MMLSVRNVAKKYRGERSVDAVRDLSFDLDQGLFMSLVGRSGSGKSSLLAAIGGISRPTSGTILIDGVDQWALSDDRHADFRNQEIGYVFQFASLLPSLRAIDNVALPALMGGKLSEKAAYARARMLLERVGLGERVDFFPGHLSGGEQRRVAIARALINSPRLLLADEPTADLDEKTEEEILNLLIDIHRSYGLTLLVVTHNPAIAQRADRLLELQDGLMIRESAGAGVGAGGAACLVDSAGPAAGVFEIDQALVEKERVSLGVGIERYVGRLVLMVVPLVLVFWGLNLAVSKYEAGVLEAQQERRSAVEELAMKDLRADIKDVTFAEGKGYVLSLYLQNVAGDKEIYVMSPTVRAFIQVGSSWQEVKLTALDGEQVGAKVQKIEGEKIYKYLLEPDVDDFAQLLPYYMHIRISNDMLVSPSSEPKNDLVDRSDNYYVYLKPHDASDAAILKKMKFPGKPPVWIPMPPH